MKAAVSVPAPRVHDVVEERSQQSRRWMCITGGLLGRGGSFFDSTVGELI